MEGFGGRVTGYGLKVKGLMVKGEGLKVKGTRVNGQEQRVFDRLPGPERSPRTVKNLWTGARLVWGYSVICWFD